MIDNEIVKSLTTDIETIRKIRLVLSTITIEARNASDVVSIDNALASVIDSLAGIANNVNAAKVPDGT